MKPVTIPDENLNPPLSDHLKARACPKCELLDMTCAMCGENVRFDHLEAHQHVSKACWNCGETTGQDCPILTLPSSSDASKELPKWTVTYWPEGAERPKEVVVCGENKTDAVRDFTRKCGDVLAERIIEFTQLSSSDASSTTV